MVTVGRGFMVTLMSEVGEDEEQEEDDDEEEDDEEDERPVELVTWHHSENMINYSSFKCLYVSRWLIIQSQANYEKS